MRMLVVLHEIVEDWKGVEVLDLPEQMCFMRDESWGLVMEDGEHRWVVKWEDLKSVVEAFR